MSSLVDVSENAALDTSSDQVESTIDGQRPPQYVPNSERRHFGSQLRNLIAGVLIATGSITFTGCGATNKPQEDGIVVCNGKAISFDQLSGRIDKVEALHKSLSKMQENERVIIQGLDSEGPEWISKNQAAVKAFVTAAKSAESLLADAANDEPTFKPLKEQIEQLLNSTREVIAATPDNFDAGMAKDGGWRRTLEAMNGRNTGMTKTLQESLAVLSPIALRAISHETSAVLAEFIVEFKESGRDWFKNVERHNDLLARLDRTAEIYGRYESKAEIQEQREDVKNAKNSIVEIRQLLANPANFDLDSGNGFDSGAPGKVSSTRDSLIKLDSTFKAHVDRINPDIQRMPVEESQRRQGSSGHSGGSHSFIFFHMGNSYSSAPSSFGGGRSSFSAPVSRGGFGTSGAHAAFGG